MMKFFALIPLFISISTFAQEQLIGFQYGKSWMNVDAKEDFFEGSKSRKELSFGLTYEVRLKNNFLVGFDLMYYQRGYYYDILYVRGENNILEYQLDDDIKNQFNYIGVPIKVGYATGKKVEAFFNAGIIPSIIYTAYTYYPKSKLYDHNWEINVPYDIKRTISKFDLAGTIEAGTNIYLTDRFVICGLVSFQHSITTLSNQDYFDGFSMRNYGITLTGGVKYLL